VLLACTDLDVTVAYTATVRPLDATGLRDAIDGPDLVVVEPSLEGTSAAAVTGALRDRPIRLLSIGVGHDERRNYGSRREHDAAWGLDAEGLRSRITAFGAHTVS
jgi:transketolase